MTQPTPYSRSTAFADEESSNVGGRSTVRTGRVDAEFDAIALTFAQTLANLALIQRDDTKLKDNVVELHTLSSAVLALLTTYGATPRGAWVTATSYAYKDLVSQSTNTYMCVTAHTSGTFATDLAAGKWILLSLGTAIGAGAVTFSPTSTLTSTDVQAAINEADTENRALSAAASASVATLIADLADVATALKGDTRVGWSAIFSIIDGVLTRHASLAAAISALGSTRADLVVRDDITLTGNATIPATCTLRIENGAQIALSTFTLTINGRFDGPGVQCFTWTSGKVVFAKDSIPFVLPQWWGAKGDAAIDASSGTDSAAALVAAVAATCQDGVSDVSIHPMFVGPGNFIASNASFPPAFNLIASGRHQTAFVAKTGTAGVWFGDAGNAAKIMLSGFAMYARGLSGITYGIRLGYGTQQHGTEGYVRDIWVRDVSGASAVWGIDIDGNVGRYTGLVAQDCKSGLRIAGVANQASEVVVYGATVTGCDLNLCDVVGIEIEAPGNACLPLKLTGNATVSGLVVALANGTTISHLVELGASCTTWAIRPFNLAFGSTPAGITVSNGNFKRADGTYFGGNATAGSRDGEGNYSSEYAGQTKQCFMLRIINNAGTLQHRISTPTGSTSNFASKVNGASATPANTPTGADASTAFVSGGKIGSATASIFWLDTISQKDADFICNASIVSNTTGTAMVAIPVFQSININGVTRTRLGIQFTDLSGTGISLNTTNIAAGKLVQVLFDGYLS